MDGLIYALGVIVFFVGLMASIALHEVGHMWPAKKFGVKVTQYFVGFGRTVWSFRRGETEYGLKSIPLGGFVKLVGMLPPAKGSRPATARHTSRLLCDVGGPKSTVSLPRLNDVCPAAISWLRMVGFRNALSALIVILPCLR